MRARFEQTLTNSGERDAGAVAKLTQKGKNQ
jgi:hypothetical protein